MPEIAGTPPINIKFTKNGLMAKIGEKYTKRAKKFLVLFLIDFCKFNSYLNIERQSPNF